MWAALVALAPLTGELSVPALQMAAMLAPVQGEGQSVSAPVQPAWERAQLSLVGARTALVRAQLAQVQGWMAPRLCSLVQERDLRLLVHLR